MYRKSLHLLALLCLALAFCTLFAACGSAAGSSSMGA